MTLKLLVKILSERGLVLKRMLKKIDTSGECHLWQGCLTPDGYPRVIRNGNSNVRGHRFFYEELHGPLPPGLVVRHTCDNRLCLNPNHLILGTVDDNVVDRTERRRTHCYVSDEQIAQIKLLRDTTPLSQEEVARIVGCSQTFISKMERGLFKRTKMLG